VGLGYVGLPLAVEFGKLYTTIGYDIDTYRISELRGGVDRTGELCCEEIQNAGQLTFTSDVELIKGKSVYVVTVPTPVNEDNSPNFNALLSASRLVGSSLPMGGVVVFESTVYPGATEEICVPEIEKTSGMLANRDFSYGYSPERINPGDKDRKLVDIVKITSGSTSESAAYIDRLYRSILNVETHLAPSIKVAEAAKVIENTQRDVNIALINELAMICERLNVSSADVLEAAGSKWNFLPFKPGLVGGHCIGVDPYYLTNKAQSLGYHPELILTARRINEGMPHYIVDRLIRGMLKKKIHVNGAKILIMGITFKENCADVRNSKVLDIVLELESYNAEVEIYDPRVVPNSLPSGISTALRSAQNLATYDAVVMAVAHDEFRAMTISDINKLANKKSVILDLKGFLDRSSVDDQL
jgi:UDP-N-acetyl-D-galactosamine dehydrogenase